MTSEPVGCLGGLLRLLGIQFAHPEDEPAPTVTGPLPYAVRADFLSEAERSFYRVAQLALGSQFVLLAKVSLGDLFYVTQAEQRASHQNRIARKHVDFLLCDPATLQPLVGVELDDASHSRKDRIERDQFVEQVFKAASLPLVRVPVQRAYEPAQLGSLLTAPLSQPSGILGDAEGAVAPSEPSGLPQGNPGQSPQCPRCGVSMVLRTAQRGANQGQSFYGCVNYPKCRHVLPVG